MMKSMNLTPAKLRLVLIACLVLLAAGGVGVFMAGNRLLTKFAGDTQAKAAEARAGESVVQDLQKTKAILAANTDTVKRASLIVAESTSYAYQDQIITDINNFANNSGLSITNITFADTKVSATTPTAGATHTATGAGAAAPIPGGIKSTTESVALKNPVPYGALLQFIHSVQNSLFKMRISQVSLSPSNDSKNADVVTSNVLNIEVYIR